MPKISQWVYLIALLVLVATSCMALALALDEEGAMKQAAGGAMKQAAEGNNFLQHTINKRLSVHLRHDLHQ